MKAVEQGAAPKLPDPDHFQVPQPHARLKGIIPRYRKVLGRMLFLASFSYFEAYFNDVVAEVLAFHGGEDAWADTARHRTAAAQESPLARPLREPKKPNYSAKYQKAIRAVQQERTFRFPSERLASFGVQRLAQDMKELRAVDIPLIARHALGLPAVADEWEKFQQFRDQRNEIAHGRADEVDLEAAIQAAQHLTTIIRRLDSHIVRHFMLLENP